MNFQDDNLTIFEAEGAPALPTSATTDYVDVDGAKIWFATAGSGDPVILLHGGLGHSGNWGHQVPALVDADYQVVLVDSRGHGRSTRDDRPYTYHLLASDTLAVMDRLGLQRAAFVGWSDGACTSLILADQHPDRVSGVLYFACNMDPSGTKEFEFTEIVGRCFNRHVKDYAALSTTPEDFEAFSAAVGHMQSTEPNYTAKDLVNITAPVTVVHSEHDEFIKREHAEYLAATIPGAGLVDLPEVSHFAPLQRPALFNQTVLDFLAGLND